MDLDTFSTRSAISWRKPLHYFQQRANRPRVMEYQRREARGNQQMGHTRNLERGHAVCAPPDPNGFVDFSAA